MNGEGAEEGAAKPSSRRRDPGSKAELRRPRLLDPRWSWGGAGAGGAGVGAFEYRCTMEAWPPGGKQQPLNPLTVPPAHKKRRFFPMKASL